MQEQTPGDVTAGDFVGRRKKKKNQERDCGSERLRCRGEADVEG